MKIFINNPFPLPLLKQETSVRCLDLSTRRVESRKGSLCSDKGLPPFSSPELTILLACGRDRELWLDPIFWVCSEYLFCILNQSDLPDSTGCPWVADYGVGWSQSSQCLPQAGQKDRGLWGREWANAQNVSFWISLWWPIHIINPVDKTKL